MGPKKEKNLEAVYPLSPLQTGILFHSIYSPESRLYVRQVSTVLDGELDAPAFRAAWQRALDRHSILRSAFVWEGVERPVQAVLRHAEVSWREEDWRRESPEGTARRLEDLSTEELRRPFQLSRAPLMRWVLIRLGETRHRLVWTFHQLVLDGWSKALLLRDVAAFYRANLDGRGSVDLPPTRPYGDYVEWLQRRDDREAEAFWRDALADLSGPTPAPGAASMGREELRADDFRVLRRQLPARSTAALQELAADRGLTLNAVVQGAWALVIGRHAQRDDVVFGTVVSGRPPDLEGVEGMVGVFINTLPLRARIEPERPAIGWLRALQERLAEMRFFEHSALADVRRWSGRPAGEALFECLYAFENYPMEETVAAASDGPLRIGDVVSVERTNYPITLAVNPGPRLDLQLVHHLGHMTAQEAERFLDHLEVCLGGIADDPDRRVGELPWLTGAERHQVLAEWNDTASAYPSETPLEELFRRVALETGDAIAVVDGERYVSYAELDFRSDRWAAHLRRLGAGPESAIGVCCERSVAMVVAELAALKAGGFYVPLDPTMPSERLERMLDDVGARLVLAQPRYLNRFPESADREAIALLDDRGPSVALEAERDARPPAVPGGDRLAYVMFTSGSTGRPKGVAIPHRAVARLVLGANWLDFARELRFGMLANPAFDASTFEIWGALLHGRATVVVDHDTLFLPDNLVAHFHRHRIDTSFLTVALFNQLVAHRPDGLAGFRTLLVGGDALDPHWVQEVFEHGAPTRLLNAYGPTESTTFSNLGEIVSAPTSTRDLPIGGPIDNTTVTVLDRRLEPVAISVTGELCIGGDGLGQGYWGQPARTAERFVPDPHAGTPGRRIYRTGDLVTQQPDGRVRFLGRLDDQVKIRGFRIEPGEVNAALLALPEVEQAVVVARADGKRGKRLVAYVVAATETSGRALRAALSRDLPEFMVPSTFIFLDEIPLNANGKVKRDALPDPDPRSEPEDEEAAAPREGIESTLASIWAEVLGVGGIGRHDDFFALGGDSILTIQIVARARERGLALSPKLIFENPTVAALAPLLGAESDWEPAAEGEPLRGPVPLTPIQRWFFDRSLPDPSHFNQAFLLTPRERLIPSATAAATAALVEHHDMLRARFVLEEGEWRQTVGAAAPSRSFAVCDLTGLPEERRRTALETACAQVQTGFDLAAGPLFRLVLFEGPDRGDQRLLACAHHLVVDVVSWHVLLADLRLAASQAAAGEAVDLPARTDSFGAWSERLAAWVSDRDGAGAGGATTDGPGPGAVGTIPVDFPAASENENRLASADQVTIALDRDATEALLHRLPAIARTSVQEVLLAALLRTLADWASAPRVVVDLEGHGRDGLFDDLDLSRTVGWFTSIAPFTADLEEGGDPASDLRAVKRAFRGWPRRGVELSALRALSSDATRRRLGASHAEVAFNYLGRVDEATGAGGFDLAAESPGPASDPRSPRHHRIEISAHVTGGTLRVSWRFSRALHRRATIESRSDAFRRRVLALIEEVASGAGRGLAPEDFQLAGLDAPALEELLSRHPGLEDVYPLSPLQTGMLYHSITEPEAALYFEQMSFRLLGALDAGAFRDAWQFLVDRHPVLRTAFEWRGLAQPLQVVESSCRLSWTTEDWRRLAEGERSRRLEARLRADRRRGFDLETAPLTRLALLRTGDEEHRVVWSCHHLLLDGWCNGLLLRDLLDAYEAFRAGGEPPARPTPPYREFIAWLASRDSEASHKHWRDLIHGFADPTPPPGGGAPAGRRSTDGYAKHAGDLEPAAVAALEGFARATGLTLATVLQGAWALLLASHAGRRDVVYGTVVSGRDPELPGVERIVGPLINTLPVRVQIDLERALVPWLRELQGQLLAMRQHDHVPLAQIRAMTDVPAGRRLFETTFAFENYPVDPSAGASSASLHMEDVRSWRRTSFPLVLVGVPGERLRLELSFDPEVVAPEVVHRLSHELEALLSAMVERPESTLGALPLPAYELRDQAPADETSAIRPSAGAVPPRNATEAALVEIWRDVLGIDAVGIEDDFYELGGDSILFIQVLARAHQTGLRLEARTLLEHPTIAGIAAAIEADPAPEPASDPVAPATGPAPLTPIQTWFFERRLENPHHFDQSVLLEAREAISPASFVQAVTALVAHHDALRHRFERHGGTWRQRVAPREEHPICVVVDLSGLATASAEAEAVRVAADLHTALDLEVGPLLRAAYFLFGDGVPIRVLLVVHHLAVDGVSWRILLEDLHLVHRQIAAGGPPMPPPTTTPYVEWARRLEELAARGALDDELDGWLALVRDGGVAPPVDDPDGDDRVRASRTVRRSLPPEETEALLREVPGAFRTRIDDALLTALGLALGGEGGELLVDLEGHGREDLLPDLDLSRTVGWFTSLYPVRIPTEGDDPVAVLKVVKERLREIPHHGVGFSILRHLGDPETRRELAGAPRPWVGFNYLGQWGSALPEGAPFVPLAQARGAGQSPRNRRAHELEVAAWIDGGALETAWSYSAARLAPATVEAWADRFGESLSALVSATRRPEVVGYTPSDFPLAGLDQATLDELLGGVEGVEDLFPVAPLQAGLLFHRFLAPASDDYFEQMTADLPADLDVRAFRRAWQKVVDRHMALRSSFLWEGLEVSLQVVHRQVEVPFTLYDWRGEDEADLEGRLESLRLEDRRRGFELDRAPLMRLLLVRRPDGGYRFVWSHHHLVLDGWSLPLVFGEVLTAYEALSSGREAALSPVHSLRAYAAWRAGRDRAPARDFWRRLLADYREPAELPADPLPAGDDRAPRGVVRGEVDASGVEALQAAARRHKVTVNTLVKAALGALLARAIGRDDLVLGTVVSGRPPDIAGIESIVGMFVNTLPVRLRVEPELPLAAWLREIHDQQREMRSYEDSPLVEIQGESGVPRGVPLFQVLYAFENYPIDRDLDERRDTVLPVSGLRFYETTEFPVTAGVVPGETMRLTFSYDRRRYADTTMERLMAGWRSLIEQVAAAPDDLPVRKLATLSAAERHRALHEWSEGPEPASWGGGIYRRFAARAAAEPQRPAVVWDGSSLSYERLDRAARRWAGTFARNGFGLESVAAIWGRADAAMAAAILGALRRGGAFLLLDPDAPTSRVEWMLRRAGASLLLTGEGVDAGRLDTDLPVLDLGTPPPDEEGAELPPPPEAAAYLVFTSGSTGEPKGAVITHRAIESFAVETVRQLGMREGDRFYQFASPSFDVIAEELLPAWVSGGAAVLRSVWTPPSFEEIGDHLERGGVTHLELPVDYWRAWVRHLDGTSSPPPRSLRVLVLGSDKPPVEELRIWRRYGVRTLVVFGLTETTVTTTFQPVAGPGVPPFERVPPIGRPIAGARTLLLGGDFEPVPAGGLGELYIGGAGLARGYVGRPALTADRFVPDPHAAVPGARLYRTGDRVSHRPAGEIDFHGRLDAQLNLRGFRIEPGEIESALLEHRSIREAAVVLRGDGNGDQHLVAFFAGTGDGLESGDLRSHLQARVPGFMVPALYQRLDALPRTASGKIDRSGLPTSDAARAEAARSYTAPRSPVERRLTEMWSELLGVEQVGVHDDFFTLGGHSLRAMQLIGRVRREFGVDVPLRSVFERGTPEAIAVLIVQTRASEIESDRIAALLAELEEDPTAALEARSEEEAP